MAVPSPHRGEPQRSVLTAAAVLRPRLDAQVLAVRETSVLPYDEGGSGIHDTRVAVRRLRSSLATFAPLLDGRAAGLDHELRWFAGELSPARDAEVLRRRFGTDASGGSQRLDLHLVLRPFLERSQADGLDRARLARQSTRLERLFGDLTGLFGSDLMTEAAHGQADAVLPPLVLAQLQRLERQATIAVATTANRDEAMHRLRRTTKRARYAAEVLTVVYPTPASKLHSALKRLHLLLGERQDSAVAREYLHRVVADGDLTHDEPAVIARALAEEDVATATVETKLEAALRKAVRRGSFLHRPH